MSYYPVEPRLKDIRDKVVLLVNALASIATDKLRVSVVDALPLSPINLAQVGGTALTGRDWSADLAKLQNLDVLLSSRASESTLSGLSGKFPAAAALSDTLGNPTATIIGSALLGFDGTYWRRVRVDTSARIRVVDEAANLASVSGTALTARDWSSDFAKLQNLDVLLSSRASEATLSAIKNALASVATDKLRVTVVDALPTSPINLVQVGGTALTARDWSGDLAKLQNLDITLTTLSALIRWGRNVAPSWVHGSEVTAPAAGATLVSKTVSTGKSGYIYGFLITASEPNHFKINFTSGTTAYSIRVVLPNAGSVESVDVVPLNEGLPAAAGSTVSITVVNAGSSGSVYQARILYAEV